MFNAQPTEFAAAAAAEAAASAWTGEGWVETDVTALTPGTEVRIDYVEPVEVEFGALVIDEKRDIEGVLTGFETAYGVACAVVRGRGPFGAGGPAASRHKIPVANVRKAYLRRMSSAH